MVILVNGSIHVGACSTRRVHRIRVPPPLTQPPHPLNRRRPSGYPWLSVSPQIQGKAEAQTDRQIGHNNTGQAKQN